MDPARWHGPPDFCTHEAAALGALCSAWRPMHKSELRSHETSRVNDVSGTGGGGGLDVKAKLRNGKSRYSKQTQICSSGSLCLAVPDELGLFEAADDCVVQVLGLSLQGLKLLVHKQRLFLRTPRGIPQAWFGLQVVPVSLHQRLDKINIDQSCRSSRCVTET